VIPNGALGAAEDQRCDLGTDDSVVREIIKPFDYFKSLAEIATVAPRRTLRTVPPN
jgi:hypothetical protein